jgi:hypothetical protein
MAFLADSNSTHSTPWVDYGSYATYHPLFNLSTSDPKLWMDIVDLPWMKGKETKSQTSCDLAEG